MWLWTSHSPSESFNFLMYISRKLPMLWDLIMSIKCLAYVSINVSYASGYDFMIMNVVEAHLYIKIPYFRASILIFRANPRKNLSNWRHCFFFVCFFFFFLPESPSIQVYIYPSPFPGSPMCSGFSSNWQQIESKIFTSRCHWFRELPFLGCSHLTQRMVSFQLSVRIAFSENNERVWYLCRERQKDWWIIPETDSWIHGNLVHNRHLNTKEELFKCWDSWLWKNIPTSHYIHKWIPDGIKAYLWQGKFKTLKRKNREFLNIGNNV